VLATLNVRLSESPWLGGESYSIADIAVFPWVRNLIGFYGAGDLVGFSEYTHVQRALDVFVARPAVQRGLLIPSRG
jgi:GSH-dependent disulfide-bond oxidoreductase